MLYCPIKSLGNINNKMWNIKFVTYYWELTRFTNFLIIFGRFGILSKNYWY